MKHLLVLFFVTALLRPVASPAQEVTEFTPSPAGEDRFSVYFGLDIESRYSEMEESLSSECQHHLSRLPDVVVTDVPSDADYYFGIAVVPTTLRGETYGWAASISVVLAIPQVFQGSWRETLVESSGTIDHEVMLALQEMSGMDDSRLWLSVATWIISSAERDGSAQIIRSNAVSALDSDVLEPLRQIHQSHGRLD